MGFQKSRSLLFVLVFFILGSFTSAFSQARPDLQNSFFLVLTPSGKNFIDENLEELIYRFGFSLDEFYFSEFSGQTEEMALEDFFSDDPEFQELIAQVREVLERFFHGFNLNKHKLNIEGQEIGLSLSWENVSLNFSRPNGVELPYDRVVLVEIELETSKLFLEIERLRLNDLHNPMLRTWGVDELKFLLTEDSHHLRVRLPLLIKNTAPASFSYEVMPLETNVDELSFGLDFKSPLMIPRMGLFIEDEMIYLNAEEIESLFIESLPGFISLAQDFSKDFVNDELPTVLTDYLNENFQFSGIDMNAMDPPGAPVGEDVVKFEWGLSLSSFDYTEDLLILSLSSFITDPAFSRPPLDPRLHAQSPPFRFENSAPHDLSVIINRGFANRIIQLSYARGYFDSIEDPDSGDTTKLTKMPVFSVQTKRGVSEARVLIEVEQRIEGMGSIAVRNPIKVELEAVISLPVKNGVVQLEIQSLDPDSVSIDSKYIRPGFGSIVRSQARKQVRELSDSLSGLVIVDELPIPDSVGGVGLLPVKTHIDRNGYVQILMNFQDLFEVPEGRF